MSDRPAFLLRWCNTGEDPKLSPGPVLEYFADEASAKDRRKTIDPWTLKSTLRPFLERDVYEWEARQAANQ